MQDPTSMISLLDNSMYQFRAIDDECKRFMQGNSLIKISKSILIFINIIIFCLIITYIVHSIRKDPVKDSNIWDTGATISECMFSILLIICLLTKLSDRPSNIMRIPMRYPIPVFIGFFGIIGGVLILFFYITGTYNKIREEKKEISRSEIIDKIDIWSKIAFVLYIIFVLFGAFVGKR